MEAERTCQSLLRLLTAFTPSPVSFISTIITLSSLSFLSVFVFSFLSFPFNGFRNVAEEEDELSRWLLDNSLDAPGEEVKEGGTGCKEWISELVRRSLVSSSLNI